MKTFKLYNKYKLYGVHTREDEELSANHKPANKLSNIEIKMPPNVPMKKIIDTDINIAVKSLDDSQTTNIDVPDIAKITKVS